MKVAGARSPVVPTLGCAKSHFCYALVSMLGIGSSNSEYIYIYIYIYISGKAPLVYCK